MLLIIEMEFYLREIGCNPTTTRLALFALSREQKTTKRPPNELLKPSLLTAKKDLKNGKQKQNFACSTSTFRHLIAFKKGQPVSQRYLDTAMEDFGFTQEELISMTIEEMIDDIISRY